MSNAPEINTGVIGWHFAAKLKKAFNAWKRRLLSVATGTYTCFSQMRNETSTGRSKRLISVVVKTPNSSAN